MSVAPNWSVLQLLAAEPDAKSPAHMAHKLMAAKDSTPRLILAHVASGPKQFKELKEGTGKHDGQLTRALSALHEDGLLVERMHAREAPAFKTHELGPKGLLVVALINAFLDAEKTVSLGRRG